MSLDGIRVNHAAVDLVAADLYSTVQEIDNRMNQLEQELSLLRNDWDGNAQVAYQSAKDQWDWAIQEMKDLLDRTSATVYDSNQAYRDADHRGEAMFL